MRSIRVVLAVAVAWAGITAAAAQTIGGFRVRVLDASDQTPIIGATVSISNTQKLVADTSQMSDKDGIAVFGVLKVGPGYVITVLMDGYATVRIPDLRVKPNVVADIPVPMLPEQTEKVTVIAQREAVELEKTKTSVTFSDEFINDLPVEGRYYQNVLTLAPGVQDSDGDGNPNVNGARDRDFKATVSGISNQDPLTGQFLSFVNPDSIEEIEVVTAGAGAEYGRAQGGFANIVQKQGSNDFEGIVNFIYSSSILDAAPNANVPSELLPAYQQIQPSFSLSGPIVKDKLWYRLSHQYLGLDLPSNLGSSVEVSKYTQWIHSDQLTWQMSPRNKMAFLFQADPAKYTNIGVSSLIPPESTQVYEAAAPTYSLVWTAPYSPSLLVESQIAYQDFRSSVVPSTVGVKNNCSSATSGYVAEAQCFDINNGVVSGSSGEFYEDHRQRLTVRSDGTYFKGRLWGMSHQFKFGLTVENERFFQDSTEQPTVSILATNLPTGPPRPGEEPSFAITAFQFIDIRIPETTKYTATSTNWGFFGEDQFKPLNNLTVTIGLRIDQEQINSTGYEPFDPRQENAQVLAGASVEEAFTYPNGLDDLQSQLEQITGEYLLLTDRYARTQPQVKVRRLQDISIVNTNPAPRLSVSWDPWSDGKTRFSATLGRFYGATYLLVPAYENAPLRTTIQKTAQFNAQTGEWADLSTGKAFSGILSAFQVDRDLKTPYQDEFTIAAEREIFPETTLRFTYVNRRFKDQLQLRDINGAPADLGRCSSVPTKVVESSPGTGLVQDPYTLQYYEDTDPGNGDGRLDDCQGDVAESGEGAGVNGDLRQAYASGPDGIADLYLQNPFWGGVYKIGNYNEAKYDGYQLELIRRQYKNWQMQASYVYSKASGEAEDFNLFQGSDPTTVDQEKGYLGYDQRHVVKVNATAIVAGGVRLGGAVSWQSGLPWSILTRNFSYWAVPPEYASLGTLDPQVRTRYPTHQRNDQRNTSYWNFDLKVQKEFRLPGRMNLQLTGSIYNLVNDQVYRIYNPGLQSGRQINSRNEAQRIAGRRFELGFRLAF